MVIYSVLFYILFMVVFQNLLGNGVFLYLLFLLLSLVLSYIFSEKFGNPSIKLGKYLEKKYKNLYTFSDKFLPEIVFILSKFGEFISKLIK